MPALARTSDRNPAPRLAPAPSATPADIARTLATRDGVRRTLARFDPAERFAARVAGDRHWEAWLLTWLPGQGTGLHDHAAPPARFAIIEGRLDEVTVVTRDGGRTHQLAERRLATGAVRSFGADHVHDVNTGRTPAISLHVHAPALSMVTLYRLTGDRLHVVSVNRDGEDW